MASADLNQSKGCVIMLKDKLGHEYPITQECSASSINHEDGLKVRYIVTVLVSASSTAI